MITIDANAMLVGIMNPVYFQMRADMALQRYIHKEKRKVEKVGISKARNDVTAINQLVQRIPHQSAAPVY